MTAYLETYHHLGRHHGFSEASLAEQLHPEGLPDYIRAFLPLLYRTGSHCEFLADVGAGCWSILQREPPVFYAVGVELCEEVSMEGQLQGNDDKLSTRTDSSCPGIGEELSS